MSMAAVFAGLFIVLVLASLAGWWMSRRGRAVENFNARVRAWWVMIAIGGLALVFGRWAVVVLFAVLAGLALREFAGTGWWLVLVPVQFLAVGLGWNGVALVLIPLTGHGGLLLCAWGLSAIPALPKLEWMLFVVLVVQACDVLQYLWGRAIGRRPVAPSISPAKTVEGLVGGVLSATALGAWMHELTPFTAVEAALVSLAITLAGFASGLVFSAIKRRRGLKDWGTAIAGHGGVLDRVDSLCLAAPVFWCCVFFKTSQFFELASGMRGALANLVW